MRGAPGREVREIQGADLDSGSTVGPSLAQQTLEGHRGCGGTWPGCAEPLRMASGSHPSLTCNRASDKEYDKHLLSLSPHTTLDSHPAKDKVRNVLPGPQGSPESPLFLQLSSKGWGLRAVPPQPVEA